MQLDIKSAHTKLVLDVVFKTISQLVNSKINIVHVLFLEI